MDFSICARWRATSAMPPTPLAPRAATQAEPLSIFNVIARTIVDPQAVDKTTTVDPANPLNSAF